MDFVAFLIIGYLVSNAALLPANLLDSSDLLLSSSRPQDSPLPDSLSLNLPAPGNDPSPLSNLNAFDSNNNPTFSSPLLDPSIPGSLSLNLPAPGNEPSPFSLNLNSFDSANNPTSSYSLELAQQPNENGAGDGEGLSTVTPSITYAETQPQTDDSNRICSLGNLIDQKRQKRESSFCAAPDTKSPESSTPEERKNDEVSRNDGEWIAERLRKIFGDDWMTRSWSELTDQMTVWFKNEEEACEEQSQRTSGTIRPHPLCCVGPQQLLLRVGPGHEQDEIRNWFNCEVLIPGRPFCDQMATVDVCCQSSAGSPDRRNQDPALYWRWGFKGVDCVPLLARSPG